MNTKDTIQAPKDIAESIRRMNAKELAALVEALCEDNMGKKLESALSFENLDKQFRSGV
jgi:hypothetical protein